MFYRTQVDVSTLFVSFSRDVFLYGMTVGKSVLRGTKSDCMKRKFNPVSGFNRLAEFQLHLNLSFPFFSASCFQPVV